MLLTRSGEITAEPNFASPKGTESAVASSQRGEATVRFVSPEALFRGHYIRLVRSLTVVTAGDGEAAADAVQDAFVQLCLHWDRVSDYDDPAAWVRRVAVNRLLNRRRSLVRRAAALIRLERPLEHPPARPPEYSAELATALRRLPDRQRVAVALHYVDGLSTSEVARSMGISKGAVDRHLHRARAALRPTLEASR